MTLGAVWLAQSGAAAPTRLTEIDIERINVREPDGTLRLAIANHVHIPGIIVASRECRHPDRREAGMIFSNDEGTEKGGLVFDGGLRNGRPTNGGSLTFDRWRRDQTLQLVSEEEEEEEEDGARREAGIHINDRPDTPLDPADTARLLAMPVGPAREAAFKAAGFGLAQRAYPGRAPSGAARLILRNAIARPRLELGVDLRGAAPVAFREATGRTTRTIEAAP